MTVKLSTGSLVKEDDEDFILLESGDKITVTTRRSSMFSQGSRSGLRYIKETNFGVTPNTPTLIELPYSTHSLNLTKERVEGNDIQPDRMPRVDRHGNRQAGGDIVVDLRKGEHDAFLESAMFNTFSTDTLKVGTTPQYMSIEDAAFDISQYRLFTGMAVSSMAVSMAPNQMVTATFSMVGQDGSISSSTVASSTTSPTNNKPFDSYSGDLSIADTGASLSAVENIQSLDFTLQNSLSPTFVIGSDLAPQLEFGRAEIEGTLSAYFEDADLVNRFLNETETQIEVSVNDPTGANPYTFYFPRVKINSAEVGVTGPNSRIISMSFTALYDSTEGSNITITRTS